MTVSLNGVQLNSKPGMDFNTQYTVPDTGLTQKTTLSNNPLYNMFQVLFNGKQTDNIGTQMGENSVIGTNGLKTVPDNNEVAGKKLSTFA